MDGLSYAVICFLLLSCASFPLSCAFPTRFSRRHLSQAPPTDPSTFTPGGSPFFPLYGSSSSPPPPTPPQLPPPSPLLPPSSTASVTFPANISALVLPRSPKPHTTSRTLIIPAISAVLAAATAIGLALFLYGRWRGQNRHFKEESKSSASDISQTPCPPPRNTNENKLTVTASTSDVLYLGNVVTSGSSFVKPESPEIRPLPPLPSRSFLQPTSEEEKTGDEDEDDDFYSPLASLAGKESHDRRRNNPYSNYSGSLSSTSDSPAMSPPSVTISPPMSSTGQHWSTQNPPSSPEKRRARNNKRYAPSLRMFSLWNQSHGFPRISSASTSPERGGAIRTPDAYARSSLYSSVSTTPDRFFRKVLETSPPRWNDFTRNVKSLFLTSSSASPAKDLCFNISESSRTLKSSWDNPELEEQSESAPPPLPPPVMHEPPPIVPPSQSFMVQKPGKKLSFSELPQTITERTKPKVKPLPWERVRRKNTWDSHKFNSSNPNLKQRSLSCDLPTLNQESRVLDSRKCQNIAFLLATLEVSASDVCRALRDGESLGEEILESLLRMAPSDEEARKLMSYVGDSIIKLAPSERFLKELLNVPFVFKRVDALLSVASFNSKVAHLRRSFGIIQAACEELRSSKMLLKLLEAVLEKGRLRGNANDLKLESLPKLVNGSDTPLRDVVQNIIESEGVKGLDAIRNLCSVLVDLKRSAEMDYGVLRSEVSTLYEGVQKVKEVLLLGEENGPAEEEQQWWRFKESMTRFLKTAAEEIQKIETEEGSVVSAVKEITMRFHGDSVKEEGQVLRVFAILRDFLCIIDKLMQEKGCE